MTRYFILDPAKTLADDAIDTIDCENWDGLREWLGCELIEATPVRIGDRDFELLVDEEGLLKGDELPPVSSIYTDGEGWYGHTFGKVAVTLPPDDEGRDVSMTDEDIRYILGHLGSADGGEHAVIVINFDWEE